MSKERTPKSKLLSHSAAALGGIAIGYLGQRRRLDRMRQENQAVKFDVLRMKDAVKEAGFDEVTRLPRRWVIVDTYKRLAKASESRDRSGEQSSSPKLDKHSLLMIDLDNFKSYNDTHGHNDGDKLLRKVGGVLIDRLRERDVVARWGGEEFSVLLPRATEADAVAVAEEIRGSIEATGEIKASIGVAEMDLGASLDDNVGMADRALYAAKENGRNKVVAYSSLTPVVAN